MGKTVIIIPTYNEAKNISSIMAEVHKALPHAYILVVDDNSPDGTADIVRARAAEVEYIKLLFRPNKEGLGKAYLHAFKEILKDPLVSRIVMMDADFSHDPRYLSYMDKAAERSEFVIGSRYVKGGATEGWEMWRMFLSKFGNIYCRLITGMPINDATAGFNMISADMLRSADVENFNSSGYAFQMELKYFLYKNGARFAEVPIVFKNRREGESKISNHIIAEGIIAPWKMRLQKKK